MPSDWPMEWEHVLDVLKFTKSNQFVDLELVTCISHLLLFMYVEIR